MQKKLRIVFMGTPNFAVESLNALLKNNYNVVGVITAPDRKAGRGKKIRFSDVKNYAIKKKLRLLQPLNLKDPDFVNELSSLNANLQIVVAFRMLPRVVWQMPEFGTFNLHASLLPQYRGAAPINHAIINGENETGVTTFFLDDNIDTGRIILSSKTGIDKDDNFESLHNKLMISGSELIIKTLKLIENNEISTCTQESLLSKKSKLKAAPKINKEFCNINWNNTTTKVYNFIRGLSPYPAAHTFVSSTDNSKIQLKIFTGSIEKSGNKIQAGRIFSDYKTYLKISCTDGYLNILDLQISGKKRMDILSFLRGFHGKNNLEIINK